MPPGRAKLWMKPLPTGSDTTVNTTGTVCVCFWRAAVTAVREPTHLGRRGQNVGHRRANAFDAGHAEAIVDPHILANVQAALEQPLLKCQHVKCACGARLTARAAGGPEAKITLT